MENFTGPTIALAEVTDDGSMDMLLAIKSIAENAHVYVGIPEEDSSRIIPYTKKDIPTNAGLLFIHSHGSHIRNIPERPVIEPAIQDDIDGISRYIATAINAYLEGDIETANKYMELAGIRGSNDAKRWFKNPNNGWPRNKYETIRRKLMRGLRNNPRKLKKALASLSLAGDKGDVTGLDQTLVDYGEMKRAITYVLDLPPTVARKPKPVRAKKTKPQLAVENETDIEMQSVEPE